ncbi:MAG TPA: AMP-binding protein, partial [Spongiibacteraceae bacterium]
MDNSQQLGDCCSATPSVPSAEFLPLLPTHNLGDVLIQHRAQPVRRIDFLREVLALANSLPQTGHVLNLCEDRYWFAVALFAAISRNIVTVLPNSSAANHTAELLVAMDDLVCIGDQDCPPVDNMPYLRADHFATADRTDEIPPVPQIRFEQKIVCVFTSGSTGKPAPHFKTFGKVYRSILAGSERIWATTGGPCCVIGTVPLRHMYGLESTVLLPIFGGGQMSAEMPFFPTEIASALMETQAPRLLVISPFHLRNLLDAEIPLPPINGILSAT